MNDKCTRYTNAGALTFQIDDFAGPLQRPDGLVVRGIAQLLAVDGENGVTDVQALGTVRRHSAEDLRDQYGHAVLAAALDRDAQPVVVRLDDAHLCTVAVTYG